jgi:two-component system cell cycle sensor histidine kinase PleC
MEIMTAEPQPLIDQATLLYALNALEDAYALFDSRERLVFFNHRCHDVLGVPDGQLRLGLKLSDVVRIFARAGVYDQARQSRAAWNSWRSSRLSAAGMPPEFRTATGRWVRAKEHALANGSMLIALRDVSVEIAAEKSITESRAAAEEASRAKSEFLANMSHELRTPLNAIIGFSETMAGELLGPMTNPRYKDYASDIVASGRHLLSVINDVLDLSKVEAGKLELHDEELQLGALFERCVALVRQRATAARVRLTIAAAALPPIVADETRLKQILINLLTNAVKFTPEGGDVRLQASRLDDGRLEMSVRDSGIGMRAEDIPRALEPFRQIDNAYNKTKEGTGLGLPLVKKLVDLHRGELKIASEPGAGTTVSVVWPSARVLGPGPRASAAEGARGP